MHSPRSAEGTTAVAEILDRSDTACRDANLISVLPSYQLPRNRTPMTRKTNDETPFPSIGFRACGGGSCLSQLVCHHRMIYARPIGRFHHVVMQGCPFIGW